METLTIDQIKSYLIDALGYSETDLNTLSRSELIEILEDSDEVSNCIAFNS